MVENKIVKLKNKLNNQILNNEEYIKLCATSIEIDKLIIEYYKHYGLRGVK